MSDKDNGGIAFPQPVAVGPAGDVYWPGEYGFGGMFLRDWLAGQAVAGGVARQSVPDYELVAMFGKDRTGIRREEIIAADAYRIADAMLAERSK